MATINDVLRFFSQWGGTIHVDDGTTEHALVNIDPGSLRLEEGHEEPVEFNDQGVVQTPMVGDARPSTIGFNLRKGHHASDVTLDFDNFIRKLDAASATKKLYDVRIQVPDYKGATTGWEVDFPDCWVRRLIPLQDGTPFPTLQIEFGSKTSRPTPARYV